MGYKLGSLFDGSGTCPLAATLCGIEPVWASEIETYPIRVTTARFPGMQHLGDITKIDGAAIPPVDIITFGSPCQDLSVAGRRAGLQEGERSSLFYEAIRIIREMRAATNGKYPRFAVWENVPGAFSSNKGQDFRCVIEAFLSLAESRLPTSVPVPESGRWPRAGVALDNGFSLAWRTLDAQFWGVPQRRRRIYLVADFAGGSAGEVLFERDGLRRNHPACGTAWENAAADVVGGAGGSGEHLSTIDARNLRLNHQLSGTLQAKPNGGFSYNYLNPVLLPIGAFSGGQGEKAGGIGYAEGVAPSLKAAESGSNSVPDVVYSLQGNGIDREVKQNGSGVKEDTSYALNTVDRHGVAYPGIFHSLTAMNARCAESAQQPNCTVYRQVAHDEIAPSDGTASTLMARDHKSPRSLCVSKGGAQRKWIVRRLTPLECCRLQGFPDWWEDGVEGSDSARYKMWGNGMALPCVLYVMQGIKEALAIGR